MASPTIKIARYPPVFKRAFLELSSGKLARARKSLKGRTKCGLGGDLCQAMRGCGSG